MCIVCCVVFVHWRLDVLIVLVSSMVLLATMLSLYICVVMNRFASVANDDAVYGCVRVARVVGVVVTKLTTSQIRNSTCTHANTQVTRIYKH